MIWSPLPNVENTASLVGKTVGVISNGKPLANQAVSVELYSREVLTARRRLIGGFYAYDNQVRTTKLGATCSATSATWTTTTCAW